MQPKNRSMKELLTHAKSTLKLSSEKAEKFFPYLFYGPPKRRTELVAKYVGSEPILDAGCGTGWMMAFLTAKGHDVVGLDLSRNRLVESKRFFFDKLPNQKIIRCTLEHIPFPDSYFKTAVLFDILEHIKDLTTALLEIKRITEKEGRLLITLPNITGSYSLINDIFIQRIAMKLQGTKKLFEYERLQHEHVNLHPLSWWTRFFQNYGFKIMKCHNVEVLTPLLQSLLRKDLLKRLSFNDASHADTIPHFLSSEWFVYCIKE